METKNKELKNKAKNREYYSKSDKNFMPLEHSTMAHKSIKRIAWLVGWIHKLDSRNHIAVGCKDGYECLTLQAMGVDCIGIDPSEDSIDEAREKARQLGFDFLSMFKVGFAEDLPDGLQVETLSCLEVIEHVVDPEVLLKKLTSIGKYVFVSTPDALGKHGLEDADRNPEHIRSYTKEEFIALCSKYGQVLECVVEDDQICISIKSN